MELKEYLSQAFVLDKLIQTKKEQILRIRAEQENITAVLTPDKVQSSGCKDKIGELSSQVIDLENEFAQDVTRFLVLKLEIKKLIDKLDNTKHQLIMTERYLNLKRWEDIASDNNYSWRQTHYIHKKSLMCMELHYTSMIYCNQ